MECRPYAAYAVYDARRFWLLYVLPLIRLILPGPYTAVALARDLLPAVLLTLYSFVKWRCCRYRLTESANGSFHSVGVREGVLARRMLHLCAEDAASVEVERTPLLWVLRARRIRISTAGLRRRTDAVLYLTAARTRRLFSLNTKVGVRYRTTFLPVAVLSLTGSNAAVGLLTIAPLLRQLSLVLGDRLSQLAIVGNTIWVGLPPVFTASANFILLGWAVSAVRTFSRYVGFSAKREGGQLHLVSGLFTRRDVLIDCHKITAVERRQTLAMGVLGLSSAVITAAGYGRDRGTRPVLIPAASAKRFAYVLSRLLPEYPTCPLTVRPRSPYRYVAAPLTFLCAVSVAAAARLWPPLTLAGLFFGICWLLVRLWGYDRGGIGITETAVSLCYPRGLALYRVQLPRQVTDCFTVTQTPFQRLWGTCTLQVRCFGEKRRRHRVWGLPYTAIQGDLLLGSK